MGFSEGRSYRDVYLSVKSKGLALCNNVVEESYYKYAWHRVELWAF
jgi:hypothetical protein